MSKLFKDTIWAYTSIFLILSLFFIQSCDETVFGPVACRDYDTYSVNRTYIQEYISDQDFKNFTPLRGYFFGSDDQYDSFFIDGYTADGAMLIGDGFVANYGADLSIYEEEFHRNTEFVDSFNEYFEDYENIDDSYLYSTYEDASFQIPGRNEVLKNEQLVIKEFFASSNQSKSIFKSSPRAVDSSSYVDKSVRKMEYDKDGHPLILTQEKTKYILSDPGSNYQDSTIQVSSYLLKILKDGSIDTIYSYTNPNPDEFYNIDFSTNYAGTFINLREKVYLLDENSELRYLYDGRDLPYHSNLSGTAVTSKDGGMYYSLRDNESINLKEYISKNIFGVPSDNGLVALFKYTVHGENKRGHTLIFDTKSKTVIDSVTYSDLSSIELPGIFSETVHVVDNPVFTSDNKLIFMHIYSGYKEECHEEDEY